MNILFFTRKYPPAVGGMEAQSYFLTTEINCSKRIVSYGGKQIWLPFVLIYFSLFALFNSKKYDLVHMGDGVLAIIGFIVKKISQTKVVFNLHGLDLTYKNKLYQFYIKKFLPHSDLYICNSKSTKNIAERKGLNNCVIIPNGIGENKIIFNKFEDSSLRQIFNIKNKIFLLTVGRLVERKGVCWFIKNVIPSIKDKIIYIVVGKGKEYHKIKKTTDRLHLGKQIYVLGQISNNDLEGIYQQADIFVMPNIKVKNDIEGFGIVALEASSHGLPVIAANLEGINDAINKNNGLLVESGRPEEFIKTIKFLLENENLRKELGKKGKEYTEKKYSKEVILHEYLAQFNKLLI